MTEGFGVAKSHGGSTGVWLQRHASKRSSLYTVRSFFMRDVSALKLG
jgi:hypothetical protein